MLDGSGHIDEQIAAYVLGALEPEEVEAVELHLETCQDCRALVEQQRRVVGLLPYVADPQPVPARARRRLREQIIERQPVALPAGRRRPALLGRIGWVAAVSAAVIAGIFAWHGYQMQVEMRQKDSQLTVLKQNQHTLSGVVGSAGGVITPLQGSGPASTAQGGVILDPTRNAALVVVDGLPLPAAGDAYVVWMVKGGHHVNAGVLPVDDQGHGQLYVTPPEALSTYDQILVTEETGALATNPRGSPLLAAHVGK